MEIKFNKVDLYKCLSEALEKHNLKLREKLKDNPKYFVDYCLEGLATKTESGTHKDLKTLKNDIKRVVRDTLTEYITDTELYTVEQYKDEVSNLLNELTRDENTLINYIRKLNVSYLAKNLAPDITISPEELLVLVDKKQIDITNPDIFAVLSRIAEVIEQQKNKYDVVPCSPPISFMLETLTHGDLEKQIQTNKNGKRLSDRKQSITYEPIPDLKNGYRVTKQTQSSKLTIDFVNTPNNFSNGNRKLFIFLLSKFGKQSNTGVIKFNLQEIVDYGIFSNVQNARRGLYDALMLIGTIRFSGYYQKAKGKIIKQAKTDYLFPSFDFDIDDIDNNYVQVDVGQITNKNKEFILSYFTIYPVFNYELPKKTFNLAMYIFFLARQRTAEIQEQGFFTLKLKTVREQLALPYAQEYEGTTKKFKPKQYVKDPIFKAIEDINNQAELNQEKNNQEKPDIKIIARTKDSIKNLEEWLDNSYIEVYLNGEIKDYFIALTEQKEQKIKEVKNYKRRKRIATAQATEPETK